MIMYLDKCLGTALYLPMFDLLFSLKYVKKQQQCFSEDFGISSRVST